MVARLQLIGRRCCRKGRVADEATMVARFLFIGVITPTFFVGRRCGRKDRVADKATMMARFLFIGGHHADVLFRATL
jgi:hypothetical protein